MVPVGAAAIAYAIRLAHMIVAVLGSTFRVTDYTFRRTIIVDIEPGLRLPSGIQGRCVCLGWSGGGDNVSFVVAANERVFGVNEEW